LRRIVRVNARVLAIGIAALVAYVGFYFQLGLQSLSCAGTAGSTLRTHICDYRDGGNAWDSFSFSWRSTWIVDTLVAVGLAAWATRSRQRRPLALVALFGYLIVVRVAFVIYLVHARRAYVG
jgi:hypothetical protein